MKQIGKRMGIILIICCLFMRNTNIIYAIDKVKHIGFNKDSPKYGNAADAYNNMASVEGVLMWLPINEHEGGELHDYGVILYDQVERNLALARVIDKDLPKKNNKTGDIPQPSDVTYVYKFNEASQYQWLSSNMESKSHIDTYSPEEYYWYENPNYVNRAYVYESIIGAINHLITKGDNLEEIINNPTEKDCLVLEGLLRLLVDEIKPYNTNTSVNLVTKEYNLGAGRNDTILIFRKNVSDATTIDISLKYKNPEGELITVDLSKLAEFIQLLSIRSDQAVLNNCEYLTNLVNSYSDYLESINKQQIDNANKEQTDTIDKIKAEFNNYSCYEKWSRIIANYVATGDKIITGVDVAFHIDNFTAYITSHYDDTVTEDRIKLNAEEILRLKIYANIVLNKSGNSREFPDSFVMPELYEQISINKSGKISPTVKADVDQVIASNSDRELSNASINSIIKNYSDIVKYLTAKVYGYQEGNPFELPNESNEGMIKTSDYLNSIIPELTDSLESPIYYPIVLNQPSNLQYISGTQTSYNAYAQLQYSLMIVSTYAAYNAGLELVDDGSGNEIYINTSLDEFIKAYKENPTAVDFTPDINRLIKIYTEITKGLDYLGVKPFSKQLEAICVYYNDLISLENAESTLSNNYSGEGEPLGTFFNVERKELSYYYRLGVALSATYIPMQTNLYDVNSLYMLEDTSFVEQFHYPFGFYRKALYIDTDVNAAVNYYVTGKKGSQRIATLSDLLSPEKDIVLYIDDNFYNIKELADMQGYTYNKLANTEQAGEVSSTDESLGEVLSDLWSDWTETSIEYIAKTGSENSYSRNVKKRVSEYGTGKDTGTDYVLSEKKIDQYLTGYTDDAEKECYNEYIVLQPYAVVSAIYRHSALFNTLSVQTSNPSPVFVSSPNLAAVTGVGRAEYNTIYNYIMLKNLEGNMGIDYKTTLDLNSPLYMDIYGNILTESGFVVIPAASNASLQQASKYNIYTAGFLSLYDNGYALPATYNNSETFMYTKGTSDTNAMFYIDDETKTWQVKNKTFNSSVYINFRDLPVADSDVLSILLQLAQQSINNKSIDFSKRVYIITEVLRGAPIENINKDFEGITGNIGINEYGIYFAYKLDELCKQLLSNSNGNSLITLPNLAYMDGIESVIVFLYKIVFAIMIILLFVKLYMDVVQMKFGIKTMLKFVTTLVLFVIVSFFVPTLMNFSYYQTNKLLLQEEASYIAILNLEKRNEGKEIGINEVTSPETNTTLYLKIDDITVPWYEALGKVLVSSAFETMEEIYKEAYNENLMSGLPGIEIKGNSLYMDLNYLFDTTDIEYDNKNEILYSVVKETPYASFVFPYYVILDQLIARVNEYNHNNNSCSYTTTIQSKGAVRTKGLIQAYFTSKYFMEESQDVLGFKNIYQLDTTLVESSAFTESDIKDMNYSLWYVEKSRDTLIKYINMLDEKARVYIANNRDLISKVSDDTFLKAMALSLAVDYNNIFRIGSANSIEIYDIDTRDIMRMSIAPRTIVMSNVSKSFSRFIYDISGTMGIMVTAMLVVVYFVSSMIKPVCIIVILCSMVASLIVRKLLTSDDNQAVEGFFISLALLCGVNVLYACCLKLTMLLPKIGSSVVISVLLQILIQGVYSFLIATFTWWILKDWKNMGLNKYKSEFYRIGNFATNGVNVMTSRVYMRRNYPSYNRINQNSKRKTRGLTGRNFYDAMRRRDDKRNSRNRNNNRRIIRARRNIRL